VVETIRGERERDRVFAEGSQTAMLRDVPEPVRLGVVGAGTISLRGILPHLAQTDVHDRVRVTAICDPAPGRAQRVADRFGIARAFPTYDELLADGDVDAVTIASPIGLHYEQGR
jgi:predicted dehydrogenase